jgi:hypothetical protein
MERRMVAGEPLAGISRTFRVGRDALRRHRAHLPQSLAALREAGRELEAGRVLDRLEELFAEAREILRSARSQGRDQVSLAAVRELRGLVELIGRITGELDERPQVAVNLALSREFTAVQRAITEALVPFPAAAEAVRDRLALVAVQ